MVRVTSKSSVNSVVLCLLSVPLDLGIQCIEVLLFLTNALLQLNSVFRQERLALLQGAVSG